MRAPRAIKPRLAVLLATLLGSLFPSIVHAATLERTSLTERVSVDSSGNQGNGRSTMPAISANGRFVAFESAASNLVLGDTNGAVDIFVHDIVRETTKRVSVDGAGNQGNGDSFDPAISASGRFVTFSSAAPNLVSEDTNGTFDVFVHDRLKGTTERVSVDGAGNQGNDQSSQPAISGGGRDIAFASFASNLVSEDTNSTFDVFVHDRKSGMTERVSVDSAGNEANGDSFDPAISSNNRFVVFESRASNLVPADTNGDLDAFAHDRLKGTTERVSVDTAGNEANGDSFEVAISANGRVFSFVSNASNLVAGDTNGTFDVFARDRRSGTTERVSVDSAGNQADSFSGEEVINASGRFIAFGSIASNLVPEDTNGTFDVFVHDRLRSTTERVSVDGAGNQGNGFSDPQAISGSGRIVAFASDATNLVPVDTNGVTDVFFHTG